MLRAVSIFAVLLGGWAFAAKAQATDDRIERVFPVSGPVALQVDSYRGSIFVEESEVAEVRVVIDIAIAAKTPEIARRIRSDLQIAIEARRNDVSVVGRNPRESRARFVWDEENETDLIYRVTVPRRCDVTVKVINGSITIGSLQGRMSAAVENGNISLRRIDGSVEARVGTGDIVLSRCTGDVLARVQQGLLRTGTLGGRADLRNASGDVEIMTAHGAVEAKATAGDVIVGFPGRLGGPAKLEASAGNIRVQIDPAARASIDARARWGRVVGKLPLTPAAGAYGKRALEADLNGGGPRLEFRADAGNVVLAPGETYFDLARSPDVQ
jgi:hypothetical protein